MDDPGLLRDLAARSDRTLRQVFSRVTPDQAAWRLPGSLANTIGATFMHIYYSEDELVQGLQSSESLFKEHGWHDRLGYNHESVWTFSGPHDLSLLQEYADTVFAATSSYLAQATPETLAEMIETSRGPQSRAMRLASYIVTHKSSHTGEIAALLGCQGAKGLPF
jgi:uncharacterized damage-inducible protein DinB